MADGLSDLIRREGLTQIYKGYPWYAFHYGLNYSCAISIYESLTKMLKAKYGSDKYQQHEFLLVAFTGWVGGLVGSSISNPFEVIAVCRQANPNMTLKELFSQNSWQELCFRGIGARVLYHSN